MHTTPMTVTDCEKRLLLSPVSSHRKITRRLPPHAVGSHYASPIPAERQWQDFRVRRVQAHPRAAGNDLCQQSRRRRQPPRAVVVRCAAVAGQRLLHRWPLRRLSRSVSVMPIRAAPRRAPCLSCAPLGEKLTSIPARNVSPRAQAVLHDCRG